MIDIAIVARAMSGAKNPTLVYLGMFEIVSVSDIG